MAEVKGFKVFNPDWTCRNKQYTCPGKFEEDVTPMMCNTGMHFCRRATDCFNYYKFNPENHVAEVIAYGDIAENGDKTCTNKLEIVREIPWTEVLEIVNMGKSCTGLCNSGDWNSGDCNSGNRNSGNRNSGNRNSGDCNSGNWNSGDWNSGNWNSGNWNSGNWNSGNWNSGNRNSGDCNSGNRNSGDCNSGDWNKTSFSNGCFNTEEPEVYMFNKPSGMTYRQWLNSDARYLLKQIPHSVWDLTKRGELDAWHLFDGGLKKQPCVLVINYELAFRRPELAKLEHFTLMLDESSMIQNEHAKRSKFVLQLHPEHVILLSGTPTAGKYERLWSQVRLLGWNIKKTTYYSQFVVQDFIDVDGSGFKIPVVIGYKNVDRLKRKLAEHGAVFMKAEEFGVDLPDMNEITVEPMLTFNGSFVNVLVMKQKTYTMR